MPSLILTSPPGIPFLLSIRVETERDLAAACVALRATVVETTPDHLIARVHNPIAAACAAVELVGDDPAMFNVVIASALAAGQLRDLPDSVRTSWLAPVLCADAHDAGFAIVEGAREERAQPPLDVLEQRVAVPSLWHVTHDRVGASLPSSDPATLEIARPVVIALVNPFRIGRKAVHRGRNDLVLEDPFTNRMHARISQDGGRWWIEDQGSGNGTHVDGCHLVKPARIVNGSRIMIGSAHFVALGL